MGFMLIFAATSGRLMDTFDSRIVFLVGSLVVVTCLIGVSLAKSVWLVYVLFAMCGIGFSATAIQAASIIQFWFSRKRGLATGIAMAGSGLGNAAFAFTIEAMLQHFRHTGGSWRQAIFCEALGGLVLLLPASLLMKPRDVRKRMRLKLPPSNRIMSPLCYAWKQFACLRFAVFIRCLRSIVQRF